MRSRLVLLGGQTIALGLMMAFLVVPASSLFLVEYGAGRLPWTYLAVAASGVLVSAGMSRAQRTWSLLRLAVTVLVTLAVLTVAAWLLLVTQDATWVTFVLLVMFPLSIPLGFVIVGSQAGRLLDLQQLKRHFPRVVAGFSVGFAIGGLAAAAAARVLGDIRHLLLVDVLANLVFVWLVVRVARDHPAELRTRPAPVVRVRTPGRRLPVMQPLVLLVFGYQVLSSAVTQLLDYLVWERGSQRYPDEHDLAAFLGIYGALLNIVSIGFVALLAGRLLSRYGVRLGLAFNPAVVIVLLVPALVAGALAGAFSLVFFLLLCACGITDIASTDGTTRTSINATYQALPAVARLRAQTMVEAAGVPLALGFVGALLLLFQALDLGVRLLAATTGGLCVVWLSLALLTYRAYGRDLQAAFRRRDWDPVALRVDDPASASAVEQLLQGDDLADLRLGLDLLVEADSPRLTAHALRLLHDDDADRRQLAVDLAQRTGNRALVPDLVRTAGSPAIPVAVRRSAAATAVALQPDTPTVAPLLESDDALVRLVADTTRPGAPLVRAALAGADRDAALAVLALVKVPDLVEDLVALNNRPGPAAPGIDAALARQVLPETAVAADTDGGAALRAVAAGGEAGNLPLLRTALAHPDPDVAAAAAVELGRSAPDPGSPAIPALVERELERAGRIRETVTALGSLEAGSPLRRALADELAETLRRVGCFLSAQHGEQSVRRTLAQLRSADDRERALAIESLLVTLGHRGRSVTVALADEPLTVGPGGRPDGVLRELADDPDGWWHNPWLRACALYAAPAVDVSLALELAGRHVDDGDPVVAETAAWILETVAVSG